MNRNRNLLMLGLCLSFVASAQTTPVTCTTASLTGTHSLVLNGRNVLSTAVLSKVFLGIGNATFDGAGGVTFNMTVNTNQTAGVAQTWTGTYTLPTNCLGTLTITSGDTASFTLIPFNQGRSYTITGQDATYGLTGGGAAQPTACLTSTFSGAFTFTGNGYALASGALSGVNAISGLLQFDGAGAVTGNWSISTSGTATPDTVTGHYTVSSACAASATLAAASGAAYTLAFTPTSADAGNFGFVLASSTNSFSGNGHSTFTNPGLAVVLAAGPGFTTPPGSLFSIYGYGLSAGKGQATSFPLPPTLASATVTVNGETAPIYSLDNTALGAEGIINAQMPLDIQPGVANVVVKNGNTVSNAVAVVIPATAVPGVFTYGNNHAAAQNLPNYTLNSTSTPASVGDTVVVYFTGGGPVQNGSALVTGGATPSALYPVAANYSATIAGATATVDYVGLVPTSVGGFYQANIVIPKVAAGDRNLVLTISGKASNATLISVK